MSTVKPTPSHSQATGKGASTKAKDRGAIPAAYANDPKFKKYTQQVEKCLLSFDSVHEWADFISFLKQLLKTFQAYMQFKEIPKKLVVAKRLSQCLNPALPTGVHQRALDVYSHILAVLGSEGLQRDLALWSSGLFPFFEYAATSVKPTLLNLFDTYYSPLQAGLRPIMKSFILALLPGLEEETGEFFDKVLGLLDRLSGTVSPSFFLQNIWLIMLTSPSARGTAINFLSRRLPRLNANEDITTIVGRDIGLMIRAFSAALEDDDLLVRRGALDLLLQSLRIDSVAVKKAPEEDRIILMRAATSVVLRRDLSLNRRIYSWLLGPEEQSQNQTAYLKTHALELLRSTLRTDMFSPSTEYARSRPFKIFVSLLDKWEIGSALSEALVLDAFKAIKIGIDSGFDTGEDMTMTASTLYEAVEPSALWRQLLKSVLSDIEGRNSSYEGLHMVLHLLSAYHQHDEEIENIHLPIVFAATLEFLLDLLTSDSPPTASTTCASLELLLGIFKHIPASALLQRPNSGRKEDSVPTAQGSYAFACAFYSLEVNEARCRTQEYSDSPLVIIYDALVQLNTTLGKNILTDTSDVNKSRQAYIHSLSLLTDVVKHLEHLQNDSPSITWKPMEWLSVSLECISAKAASFSVVDGAITAIIRLHQANPLKPSFVIDNRQTMTAMLIPLLRYLRPEWTMYHMRSVTLIWLLERSFKTAHVESIISQTLSMLDPEQLQEACEDFGVLWRLTDDALAPGFRLKVPMMIILDTLKSDNPSIRRVGETWMRCCLKSYLRILDPLLYDLHDPQIRRLRSNEEHNGRSIQGFRYERPFDQRYTSHLLESLLSVVKFGGQGFSKIARSTVVTRTSHSGLLDRLQKAGNPPNSSYMDVIIQMVLQFLQSEPRSPSGATMHPLNTVLHSTSIDLLQSIVVRGDIDTPSLQNIETIVVGKLFIAVHTRRLDLQNKLLHVLHSIISAFSIEVDPRPKRLTRSPAPDGDSVRQEHASTSKSTAYTLHPLLLQTLLDGLSTPSNRPLLQHWLDFIMMTISQFHNMLQTLIVPLTDCVCRQLRIALYEVLKAPSKKKSCGDINTFTTDADFTMLLTALERLVSLSLAHIAVVTQDEDESSVPEKNDGSGLLGYVSNVFSSDGTTLPNEDQQPSKASDYRCLRESIRVLFSIWTTLVVPESNTPSSQDESVSLIFTRSRSRCRRVLEHLFRAHALEVLECIIDCWSIDQSDNSVALDLVDVLTPSAQNVVNMICESITIRTPFIQEKAVRRSPTNPNLTDLTLFDFLEQYARRLEGPVAVQVWGRFSQLAKDIGSGLREFKTIAFSTLRCFTVLADKISQTTIVEDRRIRKELQDVYTRLLDVCLLAGRSPEGTWLRKNSALQTNGRDSPQIRDVKFDEKTNASSTSLPETAKGGWGVDIIDRINLYITSDVVPNLRKFLADSDKVLATCSSIVLATINPAMKGRSRPLDVDDNVLSVLREMTRLSVAMKAWRAPIVEVLNDNRCFNSTPNAGNKWRLMIKMLFDTDKTALTELLSRVTTAPSANIFTNREYEMLLRSLNLRRLSYVLLSGEKNHFLTQLPTIQEKLVDTLRNVNAPIVQSEVYLCIRVLLCRLSPHNLSSFWPVILTEMYRVFEQILVSIPPDGSEELGLILAASKLLDLLLVLQTEEFQIHQWIFITDTVDAIERPDDGSEALLDLLAEVVGDLPAAEQFSQQSNHSEHAMPPTPTMQDQRGRRPMLQSVRSIDSVRDLGRFFSHASIASYESVYSSGGNIDWVAVEQGLLEDMFDGR
ncbi:Dopey, N-terminal-domain-containing protein [Cristinia sonorae]|uniref:Dopey, N-terminal-domain-containing protein n=1 Tax=Cristinia sonorae TaxID=1940300 RepID=A0A8K0UP53_9AGAR|nr:Dopey, N-terminal-domain-containing protein [Cristinia sonorae]